MMFERRHEYNVVALFICDRYTKESLTMGTEEVIGKHRTEGKTF